MAGRSMRVALFFLALSALLCVLASPEESQREDGGRYVCKELSKDHCLLTVSPARVFSTP